MAIPGMTIGDVVRHKQRRKLHPSVTIDRVIEMMQEEAYPGICKSCGDDAYGVEPDARAYKCESCDEHAVYGCEELLLEMA